MASGENAEPVMPVVKGVKEFVSHGGEVFHSCGYRNGGKYEGKVLVVGCGNTRMEIALDLANFGAETAIVVRNRVSAIWIPFAVVGVFWLVVGIVVRLGVESRSWWSGRGFWGVNMFGSLEFLEFEILNLVWSVFCGLF